MYRIALDGFQNSRKGFLNPNGPRYTVHRCWYERSRSIVHGFGKAFNHEMALQFGHFPSCTVNTLVRPGAGWKKISREMRIGVGTSYRLSAEGSKTRERFLEPAFAMLTFAAGVGYRMKLGLSGTREKHSGPRPMPCWSSSRFRVWS
jgi:hypothetical protein